MITTFHLIFFLEQKQRRNTKLLIIGKNAFIVLIMAYTAGLLLQGNNKNEI